MSRQASARGFTLIELLVVIAIIALLVSILVPSLSQAKDLARQAVCKQNLHGMGLGIQQYAGDYNEVIPPMYCETGWDTHTTDSELTWADKIVKYFDTEANPPLQGQWANSDWGYWTSSVGTQPANNDYYNNVGNTITPYPASNNVDRDFHIRYSKRMHCPAQKNQNIFHYSYNCSYVNRLSTWAWSYGNLCWGTPPKKLTQYRAANFCIILEPSVGQLGGADSVLQPEIYGYPDFRSNYPGFVSVISTFAPHRLTSNSLLLDSHVGNYDLDYMKSQFNVADYPFSP